VMVEVFTGVYVQGPAGDPVKARSFSVTSEALRLLQSERARLAGRSGWRALLMREEWNGHALVALEEVAHPC
jgi:hypothetical protein